MEHLGKNQSFLLLLVDAFRGGMEALFGSVIEGLTLTPNFRRVRVVFPFGLSSGDAVGGNFNAFA